MAHAEVSLFGKMGRRHHVFSEVSGLDTETQVVEYRHGDSLVFSTIKMPGIAKFGNITMKKGVFKSDNKFWDWYSQIKMNTIKRIPITISLLDEAVAPDGVDAQKCMAHQITGTDLKSDGNEVGHRNHRNCPRRARNREQLGMSANGSISELLGPVNGTRSRDFTKVLVVGMCPPRTTAAFRK